VRSVSFWGDGPTVFRIVSQVPGVEQIAGGPSIRELRFLRRIYGPAHWRKLGRVTALALLDGPMPWAEVH